MVEFLSGVARALLGLSALLLICFSLSENRKGINWRLIAGGFLLQLALAILILKIPLVENMVEAVSRFFVSILEFSTVGSRFLFGELAESREIGAVWGFRILPTVVFFSALTSVLYYLGILQKIVFVFAWLMSKTMRLSGAESLAAAANIFVGQTEAPLIVKPYLERMTRSELACLMTGGMATIAGSVLVAYIFILAGDDLEKQIIFGKHLIAASVMSAPAAIVFAKILIPEIEEVSRDLRIPSGSVGLNLFDAITSGTAQGVRLAVNVGAMVLVFISLVAMLNHITNHWIGSATGLNPIIFQVTEGAYEALTLQFILGILFAPIAFIVGVDTGSLLLVDQLLGEGMVLTQTVSYISMAELIEKGALTDQRSIVIATYALCSFSNFASMGVQIGGISVLAPNQCLNLARFALRALIGGTCATLSTATFAGIFIG